MTSLLALRITVAALSLVPLTAGGAGVLLGPAFVGGGGGTELDSHFRYLSGIFLALGCVFLSTVPAIERRGRRFRLAGMLVVAGGVARALSLAQAGTPAWPHLIGLGLELGAVPLLMLWQWRVASAGPVDEVER